jgi:integrase
MPTDAGGQDFRSVLGPLMKQFVLEKRAGGCAYREPTRLLHRLDDFLVRERVSVRELPRSVVRPWLAKRPHESARTHQARLLLVRHFARFLVRAGYPADVPDPALGVRRPGAFAPRMLTDDELGRFFRAVDALEPTASSPSRHLVMPELFRLLYGCGFRVGDLLKLRGRDVDLDHGVITVRHAKGGKDRLVPPAASLMTRLRQFAAQLGGRPPEAFFFPGPDGDAVALRTVYTVFRRLLMRCGIAHAGRGRGPRIHDFRHLFAVHTLRRWYRTGQDLDAKLPLLATYLGHQHLSGTQYYLHLTAELFPEITARTDAAFGDVIPRSIDP